MAVFLEYDDRALWSDLTAHFKCKDNAADKVK